MAVLGERRVILLLCYINFLVYLNRGIIPGAPESFQAFITKSLDVPVSRQNLYLGLLSSVYVAAAAVASLLFGYLAMSHPPFQLITWGMAAWVVVQAMPFINHHAPKENSTLWLGIFISSLTVGMAGGYVYGSVLASTSFTWASAFYIEGALMVPAITTMMRNIPSNLDAIPAKASDHIVMPVFTMAFVREWLHVFTNVLFTLTALGYGAYTFTVGCFSNFSPTLLIGLGFFENEEDVSFVFGAVVLVSGTIGTVAGAMALDRFASSHAVSPAKRSKVAVDMLLYFVVVSTACGLAMMLCINSKTWYFVWLAVTYVFMSALGPAEMVAVIEMFPESRQAIAIAANTVVILAFGDIPSPVVLGWLKDTLAPHCGKVEVDGTPKLSPECAVDRSGLRDVFLFSVLWLLWAVVFWSAAKALLRRTRDKRTFTIGSPAILSTDTLLAPAGKGSWAQIL